MKCDNIHIDKFTNVGMSVLAIGIIVIMVVSFMISALRIEMNPDITYYAGVSKQIISGKIPFIDVKVDYTPLALYMMCVPISIWGNSWLMIIVYMYVVLLIDAILLSMILYHYTNNKSLSMLGGGLLLLFAFMSEGVYFGLEAFVLLFGLSALLLLTTYRLRWHLFIVGILCACAFWSKQYGIGFAGICGLWILIRPNLLWREKRLQFLYFASGFLACILLFISYYLVHGLALSQLIAVIIGDGYGSVGWQGIIDNVFWMLKRFPVILVSLVLIPLLYKNKKDLSIIVCSLVGICGFMLQCYFRSFYHYLILVWPFIIILTLYVIDSLPQRYLRICVYVILASCILRLFPRIYQMDKSLFYRTDRYEQKELAKTLESYVPKHSQNVYAYKSDMLYCQFYNDYIPPLLTKYGYNAGFYSNADISYDLVSAADYVLFPYSFEEDFPICVSSVRDILSENFQMEEIVDNGKVRAIVYIRK